MGHFYRIGPRGVEAAYEVPAKSGKMRDTTIKDAREMGLLPSVNEVLSIVANTFLAQWITTEGMKFAHAAALEGKSHEETVKAWAEESGRRASRGTEIHDRVFDMGIRDGADISHDPVSLKILEDIKNRYQNYSFSGWPYGGCVERCFGARAAGYAGRVDAVAVGLNGNGIVLDLKTVKGKREPVDKERRQVAGYRNLINTFQPPADGTITDARLMMYNQDTGDFCGEYSVMPEYNHRLNEFTKCFELWSVSKNYDPRTFGIERE